MFNRGKENYPMIQPGAIRNGYREALIKISGKECVRRRINSNEELEVEFLDFPQRDKHLDAFLMGHMLTATGNNKKTLLKEMKEKGIDEKVYRFKNDTVFQVNCFAALDAYCYDKLVFQSPKSRFNKGSAILTADVVFTRFQGPMSLDVDEFYSDDAEHQKKLKRWLGHAMKAVACLGQVAGNHARHLFDFSPASIIIRFSEDNVVSASMDSYPFTYGPGNSHPMPYELIELLTSECDPEYEDKKLLNADEYFFGGTFVQAMDKSVLKKLQSKGVHCFKIASNACEAVFEKASSYLDSKSN
jgi:hypothetical protein